MSGKDEYINKIKYIKIIDNLKSKFPKLEFDITSIDFKVPPTATPSQNKQSVKCPTHGWFETNLYYMQSYKFGCNQCSFIDLSERCHVADSTSKHKSKADEVIAEALKRVKFKGW